MKCMDCRYRDYEQEPYTGIFLTCELEGDVEESILKVMEVYDDDECQDYEYGNK